MVMDRNFNSRLSSSGVDVVPKDPGEKPKRNMVNVYFIGWMTLKPILGSPRPVYEDAKRKIPKLDNRNRPVYERDIVGWESPTVIVQGRVFRMPAIGDYIQVPENIAQEFEKRLLVSKDNRWFPGVTTNSTMAEAVKAAFQRAENDPRKMDSGLDLNSYSAVVNLSVLTDDQLQAEMQRRANQKELVDELTKPDDKEEIDS